MKLTNNVLFERKKMTPNDSQTVQIQFAFKFQLIITIIK